MMPSRRLLPAHADMYADLRREMLVDSPWAFGSSADDDRFRDPGVVRSALAGEETMILGVLDAAETRVLAAAGVVREAKAKRRHIATMWGVYVAPEARGRGFGRAVVAGAVEAAKSVYKPAVGAIELSVSEHALAARRLYESLGFTAWGIEPDALRVEGKSYAEIHMQMSIGI
ncbi:MAG: N-acetyltransferase [Pyrinomonadaceae bacterium]|nr:N-acetyltransferase [Phycisphaerales bacterium]